MDMIGLTLAAGAMILMALSSMINLKAEHIFRESVSVHHLITKEDVSDIISSTISNGISRFFSGTTSVIFLIFFTDDEFTYESLSISDVGVLLTFTFIVTLGGISYVIANIRSRSSGINMLWNLTPLVAVGMLFGSGIGGPPDAAVYVGAILIVAANLAVSMELALTRSFYVFLFAFCAVVTYDHFVPGLQSAEYFSAIGIPVGLFAIISSFLIARLQDRKNTHLLSATTIINQSTNLPEKIQYDLRELVHAGLETKLPSNFDIRVAEISSTIRGTNPALSEEVTKFGLFRLRHINYSEGTVIWVLSLLIVLMAMVFRNDSPIVEITAIFLSSIVIFLASYATEFSVTILDKILVLGPTGENHKAPTHADLVEFRLRSVVGVGFTILLLTLYLLSVFIP